LGKLNKFFCCQISIRNADTDVLLPLDGVTMEVEVE
jgi:hypothetical protein